MSELREALQLAAALPELQKQALERAQKALVNSRLSISDLQLLADTLENFSYAAAPQFQSANGALPAAIMKQMDVKVRVAEWHIVNGRCEHKQYTVGSTTRARIGNIGDATWIEAWIA